MTIPGQLGPGTLASWITNSWDIPGYVVTSQDNWDLGHWYSRLPTHGTSRDIPGQLGPGTLAS